MPRSTTHEARPTSPSNGRTGRRSPNPKLVPLGVEIQRFGTLRLTPIAPAGQGARRELRGC